MIDRALLIANPAARRGYLLAKHAAEELEAQGIGCDVRFTEHPGHAAEIASADGGHDVVFSLGGDGTAMEIAGALSGSTRLLGVLPGGTGNLLARALGTPLDVREAVRALVRGRVRRVDLGRFDSGHRFAVAAGVGIDAAMVHDTPSWLKRRIGVFAYVLTGSRAALRTVSLGRLISARVTVDGETVDCDAAMIMIANFGGMLNDRFTLGEGITADDGYLDVCVFAPPTLHDAFSLIWRLMMRDFSPHAGMLYRRGREIRVETERPEPVQADGDLIGVTPFTVTVEPRAVGVLVPPW